MRPSAASAGRAVSAQLRRAGNGTGAATWRLPSKMPGVNASDAARGGKRGPGLSRLGSGGTGCAERALYARRRA